MHGKVSLLPLMYLKNTSTFWGKCIPVIIDLEYSGDIYSPKNCAIWELAAKYNNKEFHVLINPYLTRNIVPPAVHEKYKMPSKEEFENANAVSFNVAIQLFSVFLRGLLVAEDQHILLLSHNSFRSDKIVLEHELIRHRMHRCLLQLPLFFFDTLHFVRAMKPKQKSYSLNSLYELFFHKRIKNAHAARSDVGALEEILKKINKPYEGVIMMLFLTPFSNINGIGLQTEKKIMSAGYSCLEHFYSVNGIFTKNIIDGLIQLRIFHDIALLNRISMEMTQYGIKRLTV